MGQSLLRVVFRRSLGLPDEGRNRSEGDAGSEAPEGPGIQQLAKPDARPDPTHFPDSEGRPSLLPDNYTEIRLLVYNCTVVKHRKFMMRRFEKGGAILLRTEECGKG